MPHTIDVFDLDRSDFAVFLRCMQMDLTVTEYDSLARKGKADVPFSTGPSALGE